MGQSQAGGGGHIRSGSQPQASAPGSQQQGQAASGHAQHDVGEFLVGLDAQLRGEAGAAPASQAPSSAPPLRVAPADVRLPPLPAGRSFADEYEVVMLMDAREQVDRSKGQGVKEALERNLQQARGEKGGGTQVMWEHVVAGIRVAPFRPVCRFPESCVLLCQQACISSAPGSCHCSAVRHPSTPSTLRRRRRCVRGA